jgi:AcrR family transcriptional regulator
MSTLNVKSKVEDPERIEARRAQLTAAAIAAFSEQGYHTTTIRDIAQRAGVSVGLIYQYVHDKEDLLYLALLEVLESYRRQIPQALEGVTEPLERFGAAVRAYCKVNDASGQATLLAYRETQSLGKERRSAIQAKELQTNDLIKACVRDCVEAGLFADDVDLELFTYQVVMFCHAWVLKAWRFRGLMGVDEYVDRGLRLLLNAVLTARGERQLRESGGGASAPRR